MYLSSSYDSKKSDSTDDSNNTGSTSSGFRSTKFSFPSAPRLCKSVNNTSCSVSCPSDSSASDGKLIKSKRRHRKKLTRVLPPIGVFWDIENCQVPKNKSAAIIVQRIRELFFDGYREAEFIVVCDVKKENPQVIQDLHDAQVNLIHVLSTSKNAADEKLRQSLRRFAETHQAPATIVLISGDVNFAADLSDLRYRKKIHVILVHNANVADALILCANETYKYSTITDNLPLLKNKMTEHVDLVISNLPMNFDKKPLKNRLSFLSDNCGGKVIDVNKEVGTAKIRFSSLDFASRAQRRLNGEDVFGRKIVVTNPNEWRTQNSPRSFAQKYAKNSDHQLGCNVLQPNCHSSENAYFNRASCREASWRTRTEKPHKPPLVLQEPNTFQMSRSSLSYQEQALGHRQIRPKTPQDEPLMNLLMKCQRENASANNQKVGFTPNNSFQPIPNQSAPVELMITNLDSSIKDLHTVLMNLLKEHAMIYNVNIVSQQDGSPVAIVKVGSQHDAHNIISQMHHQKLGFKRITICYTQTSTLDSTQLKEMVIMLLQDAPLNCMPLYRLLNLLEERFLTNVSVSEVNKLKDVCRIIDENGERIISLTPEIKSSPLTNPQRAHMLYCSVHCPNGISALEDLCWGGSDDGDLLDIPHVNMPLKTFTVKLNTLLNSHMGTLPLLSFSVCYKHEFNEPLPLDPKAVPLEHMITCVSNVKLKYGGPSRNTKFIIRDTTPAKKETEKDGVFLKSLSPSITSNINLLSRELVDLLKTTDRCQIQVNKYIPAYHHHFGRQLRVADYGYTKLSDLLQSPAISNIVQILGEGSKRVITLTHSTQMRRFTSDLLRVLKTQISKQLLASEFPAAYEKVLNKPFNAVEYGLCSLDDLLEEMPEHTVVISQKENGVFIAIPKREQTSEEIIRTKQFAEEVIKLLSYSPQCAMLFNKFVPAYHHHFGHQCKVSDYGFLKLIELFEAIPETVKVEEMPDGERKVCLTLQKALIVRGSQIAELIRKSHLSYLPLEGLGSSFQREYGYPLKPQYYECKDINELISKLGENVKVTQSSAGPLLIPVESGTHSTLALRVWALLINPPHHLNLNTLLNLYNTKYQSSITVSTLEQLNNVIINRSGVESIIFLTPPYAIAAKMYLLLYKEGGQIAYNSLDNLYNKHFGISLFQSEDDTYEKLLTEFSFLIIMRRTRKRTNIALNPKITEYGLFLPNTVSKNENVRMQVEESVSWPPPPVHNIVLDNSGSRGITPPKPDTPPAPGSAPWKNWETPTKYNASMDFSIQMPAALTPKLVLRDSYSLMSPTKNLLSANSHPLGSMIRAISPPNPKDLPMPDKLLKKGIVYHNGHNLNTSTIPRLVGAVSDDSTDSGVNNSHTISENEMDISCEQTGTLKTT